MFCVTDRFGNVYNISNGVVAIDYTIVYSADGRAYDENGNLVIRLSDYSVAESLIMEAYDLGYEY